MSGCQGASRRRAARMKRWMTMWQIPTWVITPWWLSSIACTTARASIQRAPSSGVTSVAAVPAWPSTWIATGASPPACATKSATGAQTYFARPSVVPPRSPAKAW